MDNKKKACQIEGKKQILRFEKLLVLLLQLFVEHLKKGITIDKIYNGGQLIIFCT